MSTRRTKTHNRRMAKMQRIAKRLHDLLAKQNQDAFMRHVGERVEKKLTNEISKNMFEIAMQRATGPVRNIIFDNSDSLLRGDWDGLEAWMLKK